MHRRFVEYVRTKSISILMGREREKKWDLAISLCCCSCSCTLRHTSLAVAFTLPILVKRAAILSLRRNPAARRFSRWLKQASMEPAGVRNIEGGVSKELVWRSMLKNGKIYYIIIHTIYILYILFASYSKLLRVNLSQEILHDAGKLFL